MNTVIYHSYDDIRIENEPVPAISDDELLVQVHGCGLCGSDIVKIVQQTTLLLPDTLSTEEGSFTEPLACCVRAVRRTLLLAGDTVVVVGLGSVGLLMLQAVKALGTSLHSAHPLRVIGVDLLPERLQLARELGADEVFAAPAEEQDLRSLLAPLTEGRGADAIIITVPGARPFAQALASVRKGGIMNIFAAQSGAVPVNLETLYLQEIRLISTYSSSPEDLHIALDLLSSRKVRVDRLISHRLPLKRFHEGVSLMRERAALKVYFQIAGEGNGKYTV